jgi:hypothetical protein
MANSDGSSVNSNMRPDARIVNEFHTNDDIDKDAAAHHHSLGTGANQAASGAHRHENLGEGIELSGSRGGNLALQSVINAMVQLFGVTDNTSV